MNYLEFIKQINSGNLSGYYLFQGEEIYLSDNTISLILDKYLKSAADFNYQVIDASSLTSNELYENLVQLPFMGNKRVLVIRDFEKDHIKYLGSKIEELLKDSNHLIAIFNACPSHVKKTTSLYKILNKKGRVVDFDPVNERQLKSWIIKKIKNSDKTIDDNALELFITHVNYSKERVNKSLYEVEKEVQKLLSLQNKSICEEDIIMLTNKSITTNIFKLTEAIGNRDEKAAIAQLEILEIYGEEPIKTLFMISRQFLLLYGILTLKNNYTPTTNISGILGIGNYEFNKLLGFLKNYNIRQIKSSLLELQHTDETLKSKKCDRNIELFRCVTKIINSF